MPLVYPCPNFKTSSSGAGSAVARMPDGSETSPPPDREKQGPHGRENEMDPRMVQRKGLPSAVHKNLSPGVEVSFSVFSRPPSATETAFFLSVF